MTRTITLGILLLSAITARAQDTVYNRFSLDVQFGANNPTAPMSSGYDAPTLGMFHAGLGARYMFTQRFGLRLGLGYDQLGEREGTPEFNTDYYSASLEGVANLGKIFHFDQRIFTIMLHAGLGYSLMDGENNAAADVNHMAHGVIGLTPQFRLGERVNLYVDAAMKAHVYQQYTYDFRPHSQRGVDGYLYNLSIGLQFNLGPHARHADWASEDRGNRAALSALQSRVNQLEQQQRDDDGDGVANYLDEEPGTPAGTKVDTKGRTVVDEPRDSDSDGIPDDVDDCPFEKGKPGDRGCPQAQGSMGGGGTAGSASAVAMVESSEVKFPTDESTISSSFASMLDGIVGVMNANPSYNLNIVGHADDRASSEYNMALSQRRADAVRSYMISKGIAASRLSTTAKGETQPKVQGTSVEARAENRRVQFLVNR